MSFNQAIKYSTVVTFQGKLYIIGGDKNNTRLSTVQGYNPDTNRWQEVAPLSIARSGVSAVADRNYLYAVGGFSSSGAVDMVERFDPKETRWKRIASMHSKRGSAGGAAFNEKVFIFGGHSNDSYPCQMYDPAVDAWLSFANSAGPRITGFSSAVSFKGKIFVCSFVEDKINEMSLQMYDPDRNAWESCMGISCVDIPLFPRKCRVCSLRIPREVFNTCDELFS